jgi:hypothetical protein
VPVGASLVNLKDKSVTQNGEASTLPAGAAEFAVILCEKFVPGRTPGAGLRKRPDFRSKMLVLMTSPGPDLCPLRPHVGLPGVKLVAKASAPTPTGTPWIEGIRPLSGSSPASNLAIISRR